MSDSWYLDEGVPGTGPRPEFLKPKFNSLSAQAKAYNELEKRFGEAPEQYDFTRISGTLDANNQHVQSLAKHAKEHRLSQEGFNKMLDSFVEYDKSTKVDPTKEMEKLGIDGHKQVERVDQWAKNTLTPANYEKLSKAPQTAEMVVILDELRQRMASERLRSPQSQSDGEPPFKALTEKEVRQEMQANYDKYMNDANYRDIIRKKFEIAVGNK